MNKTIVVFANGGTMATTQTALWQYDYGQILIIQGVQLPTAYEVQFCNTGDDTTITSIGDANGVVIPDQFLRSGETIYAYIYLHTGNADGETEYKITIPVMNRAEPTDIEPTPEQESTIGQLIDALNAGVEAAEEAAEKSPKIIDGYWYVWDTESGEYVNTNVKAVGVDGTNGANGNGIWFVDEQYTRVIATGIQAQTPQMVGRTGVAPEVGDLCVVSDGQLCVVTNTNATATRMTVLADISGEDGFAPEVTIEEIPGGHRVTITSASYPEGQSFDVMDGTGGGGGTGDYDDLTNKPQINSVELSGDKSLSDLGIEPKALTVHITESGGTYSSDKSYAQIMAAVAADKRVVAVLGSVEYQLTSAIEQSYAVVFTVTRGMLVNRITIAYGDAVTVSSDAIGDYSLPSGGIPATDLASAVQTSLGKADTALQSAPVTSVNGQTGAVSLSIPSSAADVGAVAANQGAANADKLLGIGNDGSVVPVTSPSASQIQDAVDDWLDDHASSIGGLSFAAKSALLACFRNVAWINDDGQTYYDALEDALFNGNEVVSISAVYTQSGTVYITDTLDSLKADLVVTATYSDSSTATVAAADYTLSGTLTEGTSTITVSYGGKTDTFSVTVKYLPNGYIKDGLVFFLDSKHGASASQWTDLVGDKAFALTDCTFGSDGVVFNGTTSMGTLQGGITDDWENETIEVVIDGRETITSGCILSQTWENDAVGISMRFGNEGSNRPRFVYMMDGTNHDYYWLQTSQDKNRIGVAGSTLAVLNGTKATSTYSTYYAKNLSGTTYLGCHYVSSTSQNSAFFKGKILAVRIYNRKLTESEINANQSVDASYYNV